MQVQNKSPLKEVTEGITPVHRHNPMMPNEAFCKASGIDPIVLNFLQHPNRHLIHRTKPK